MHTGTGRISKMPMYPMSLYESKESTGTISLRLLFDDPAYDIDGFLSDMTVEKLILLLAEAVGQHHWTSLRRRHNY